MLENGSLIFSEKIGVLRSHLNDAQMPSKIFHKIVAVVGAEMYNHAAREH